MVDGEARRERPLRSAAPEWAGPLGSSGAAPEEPVAGGVPERLAATTEKVAPEPTVPVEPVPAKAETPEPEAVEPKAETVESEVVEPKAEIAEPETDKPETAPDEADASGPRSEWARPDSGDEKGEAAPAATPPPPRRTPQHQAPICPRSPRRPPRLPYHRLLLEHDGGCVSRMLFGARLGPGRWPATCGPGPGAERPGDAADGTAARVDRGRRDRGRDRASDDRWLAPVGAEHAGRGHHLARADVLGWPAASALDRPPVFGGATPSPGATVTTGPPAGSRPADVLAAWASQTGNKLEVPWVAMQAYGYAELVLNQTRPQCHLKWTTLAAIAKIESNHGRHNAVLGDDGESSPRILGPVLDGTGDTQRINDTDDGVMDGDITYDRAVGAMQFIPSTWKQHEVDADNDGLKDVNDIDDAALAAGNYLCQGGRNLDLATDWWNAILSYNDVRRYAQAVFDAANDYGNRSRT
ncbi:lytic murein transglycosylase [Phytohabitans flavus]|uniref:lytic transglycosylase domain-containing protein n=1 Tax=Phytohabitans flavus TaxID=1076124 RepID=UPI0036356472